MLIQPDLIVQDVATRTLEVLRSGSPAVDEIFAQRPIAERQEISDYLASARIPVKLGYPRDVTELPGVYVVLGRSDEDTRRQPVGGFVDETDEGVEWVEEDGTFFQTTIRAEVWSQNANLTVWLQNVLAWGFLRERSDLNVKYGLHEQVITISDFEPLPRYFPDFAFRRVCALSAKHVGSVALHWPKVSSIRGTVESAGETESLTLE